MLELFGCFRFHSKFVEVEASHFNSMYQCRCYIHMYQYTYIPRLFTVWMFNVSLSHYLVAMDTDSPGVAARALANVADVLGCMAGSKGGIRSGPSANVQWKSAYDLLEVKANYFASVG